MTSKPNRLFDLQLECDNDAFAEDRAPSEVARILRKVAETIESGGWTGVYQNLFDVNGNRCGAFRFKAILAD